jgi:hypothetical protein
MEPSYIELIFHTCGHNECYFVFMIGNAVGKEIMEPSYIELVTHIYVAITSAILCIQLLYKYRININTTGLVCTSPLRSVYGSNFCMIYVYTHKYTQTLTRACRIYV